MSACMSACITACMSACSCHHAKREVPEVSTVHVSVKDSWPEDSITEINHCSVCAELSMTTLPALKQLQRSSLVLGFNIMQFYIMVIYVAWHLCVHARKTADGQPGWRTQGAGRSEGSRGNWGSEAGDCSCEGSEAYWDLLVLTQMYLFSSVIVIPVDRLLFGLAFFHFLEDWFLRVACYKFIWNAEVAVFFLRANTLGSTKFSIQVGLGTCDSESGF